VGSVVKVLEVPWIWRHVPLKCLQKSHFHTVPIPTKQDQHQQWNENNMNIPWFMPSWFSM
jgi:hypothetical protein